MVRREPAMLHFRKARETAAEALRRWIPRTDRTPEQSRWWPSLQECRQALMLSLLVLLTAMLFETLLGVRSAPDPCDRPTSRPSFAPMPCPLPPDTPPAKR